MNEIEFVKSVQVLEIKPGDLLVIKIKDMVTSTTHRLIREHVRQIAPEARCIILDADTDIGIIRGS